MSPAGLGPPPAVVPPRAPVVPPYSPTGWLNNPNTNHNATNMSGNSLTDALLLLGAAYLSVVQPAPGPPKVGLFTILPRTYIDFSRDISGPFQGVRKGKTLSKYSNVTPAFDVTSSWSKSDYSPKRLLEILCNDVFGNNTITVFYMNNAVALSNYHKSTVEYLPQVISSLGLPIISYDTQFSFNRRTPMSIQLAPTMGQMMDVFFAFLKRYNWSDFSFLCTLSKGCLDEIATIRLKVEESMNQPSTNIFGEEKFSFKLLSYVNFTDGMKKVEVEEKLRYELDRDTRVILIHGKGAEVKSILETAEELGMTTKEYVWIFTMASISILSDSSSIHKSYPLGSFVMGYDSTRDDMKDVIANALDIWLQALNSLAGSSDMEQIEFETGFTCYDDARKKRSRVRKYSSAVGGGVAANSTDHYLASNMRWPYGDILYRHLLKSKLRGTIEFDQHGILKSNRFWIKNIQIASVPERTGDRSIAGSQSGNRPPSSPRRPPSRPSSNRGRFSGRDRSSGISSSRDRTLGISSSRDHSSGISSSRDRTSGIPSSRDRPSRLPSNRNRSFGNPNERDRTSRIPSDRGRFSGRDSGRFSSGTQTTRNRSSRISSQTPESLESRSLRTSDANSFLKGADVRSSQYRSRSDEERREPEILQTTAEPQEGEDRFIVGDGKPGKNHYRITSSTDQNIIRYYDNDGANRPDTSPSGGSKLFGWSKRLINKSGPVTPVDNNGNARSKRFVSQLPKHIAKKIASWDGHKLTISAITWPGGATKPPKGKPEKYVLRVVTWREDPHVIFVEHDNATGECDSHSLPCKVYVRNPLTHVPSNETKDMCCTGLAMDLLKRLSEELHIDVDLQEVKDGAYGSPLDANMTSWTGLIGMLTRNEADLAMAAMAITPERSEAVEFSMPFLQTGITIIVAIRPGVISATAFLEPYDYLSWTLILVFSVHATGTSIFIFEWLSPYGLDHGKTPLSVHKFSLFRSFWLIWAMLFGASVSTDMPRGCASRFLANIWALFAVVFCASYTANLAAFMITKDDFYDLSGIQDWRLRYPHHRQPPFKFATITNSSTDTNIAKNFPQIHSFMSAYGQYDPKDAIESLKNQEIQAFIYDSTTLEYEVGKDVGCKLKTVGKRIAETGYGVAFPKKSQWLKKFNVALLRLQEDGEIERIQKFWLAGACHKKKEGVGVSSHTLEILNFTSAFIFLGGGIILAALLLTLEHMYFRFGRKQLKKWDKYGCCSLVSLSMGQSLTFERSVMEAIDFHKHHKCKDPICETQLWKVKHELDIALLKIAQLRKQIAYTSSGQPIEDGEESASDQAIGGEEIPFESETYHNGSTAPRRRRQTKADEGRHAGGTTKPLLHSDGCDSDNYDDDSMKYGGNSDNNYSLLQDGASRPNNYNKPKPKPKPPPRNSSCLQPDTQQPPPAVKPRQPAKRHHEKSNHRNQQAPSRDTGVNSRGGDSIQQQYPHRQQQPQQQQLQQVQPQQFQHQPYGNKIHPQKDDRLNFNNSQQQSFPDSRSNNTNNNTTNSPNSPNEPTYAPPPYPSSNEPLKLSSPTNDGTAPASSSYPSPPSPPLPPPPTPPPIIDNIQDPCSNDSPLSSPPSSRPASCLTPFERAGAITPAPSSSEAAMFEPVQLETIPSYPPSSSPSSPTSSSSQTSHNPPLSPGGVSELSNEGMSLPSSPDRLSYSSDTFANSNPNSNTNNHRHPTQARDDIGRPPSTTPTSTQMQGNGNTTNPFLQHNPHYSNSNSPSSLDNQNSNSSSEPNSVVERKERGRGKNGDVTSMTSLKEADNDVDSRRGRKDEGNVYVNVDDIGGKETTF